MLSRRRPVLLAVRPAGAAGGEVCHIETADGALREGVGALLQCVLFGESGPEVPSLRLRRPLRLLTRRPGGHSVRIRTYGLTLFYFYTLLFYFIYIFEYIFKKILIYVHFFHFVR